MISILLVSWNTADELRACLASLPANADDGGGRVADPEGAIAFEILAVDNASRDESAAVLADFPNVRLTRNSRNVGFAQAVNQAYRQSRGEYVLLLNSDVQFHPGTLQRLVSFLTANPGVAGVSPRYLNPDGTFQQHYVNFPSLRASLALITALRRVPHFRDHLDSFTMRDEDFSRPRQLASGSCMLLRRSALPAGPLLDERFPVYWNDAVLARSLFAAGEQLWMLPDVAVTHARGASCRLLGPAIRQRHLVGSLVTYLSVTRGQRAVRTLQATAVADHAVKRMLGRPTAMRWSDLRAALQGDPGQLPDGDTRQWRLIAGAKPFDATAVDPEVSAAMAAGDRVVVLDPDPSVGVRRARIQRHATDLWVITPGVGLPTSSGRAVAADWNRRAIGAKVRELLDTKAGTRVLSLTDGTRHDLVGALGEDRVVAAIDLRSTEVLAGSGS